MARLRLTHLIRLQLISCTVALFVVSMSGCQAPEVVRKAHLSEAMALANYDANSDALVRGLIDLKLRKDLETISTLTALALKENEGAEGNIPLAKAKELYALRDAKADESRKAAKNALEAWAKIRLDFQDATELHDAIRKYHEAGFSEAAQAAAKGILAGLAGGI